MKAHIPGSADISIDKADYDVLAKLFGSDFVGLFGGDLIKYWRWKNLAKLATKILKICDERGLDPSRVAPKFAYNFFNNASLEDDDTLLDIWAKLLAGECEKPGSISSRTLDVARHLSREEAKLFEEKMPYFFCSGQELVFLPSPDELLEAHDITCNHIILLQDCGLLSVRDDIALLIGGKHPDSDKEAFYRNGKQLVHIKPAEDKEAYIGIYGLTPPGRELYMSLNSSGHKQFTQDYYNFLRKNLPTGYIIELLPVTPPHQIK